MLSLVILLWSFQLGAGVMNQTENNGPTNVTENTSLASNKTSGEGADDGGNLDDMSPEEFCALLNISVTNCNCKYIEELYGVNASNMVCDENGEWTIGKQVVIHKTTFTCVENNLYLAVFNTAFSCLGIVGNALVVLLTCTNQKKVSAFKAVIVALAVSDLIFCIMQLCIDAPKFHTCRWVYGQPMCKVFRSSLTATAHMAVGFIAIIAYERFFGIVRSTSFWMTSFKLNIIGVVNVVLAICSVVPLFLTLKLDEFDICNEHWPADSNGSLMYTWFSLICYFMLPIGVAGVLYTWMTCYVRGKILKSNYLRDEQRVQRLKANRRTTTILFSIVVLFFILVLPNKIYWLLMDHRVQFDRLLWEVITGIPYTLHAAVNPIIYSAIDVNFRKQLAELFCCRRKIRADSKSVSQITQDTHL